MGFSDVHRRTDVSNDSKNSKTMDQALILLLCIYQHISFLKCPHFTGEETEADLYDLQDIDTPVSHNCIKGLDEMHLESLYLQFLLLLLVSFHKKEKKEGERRICRVLPTLGSITELIKNNFFLFLFCWVPFANIVLWILHLGS